MTGSRDLNHPDSSDALTSHSCKYQLAVASQHLVASAKDLNSHHLIEFTVKRGMIWDFSDFARWAHLLFPNPLHVLLFQACYGHCVVQRNIQLEFWLLILRVRDLSCVREHPKTCTFP